LVAAPRWSYGNIGWQETSIAVPAGRWTNRLTGESMDGGDIRMAKLLERFPVALLARGEESSTKSSRD
jgi:(1->4)-alpha-D-glucan 1-alpha-D-glucosylmutase